MVSPVMFLIFLGGGKESDSQRLCPFKLRQGLHGSAPSHGYLTI